MEMEAMTGLRYIICPFGFVNLLFIKKMSIKKTKIKKQMKQEKGKVKNLW